MGAVSSASAVICVLARSAIALTTRPRLASWPMTSNCCCPRTIPPSSKEKMTHARYWSCDGDRLPVTTCRTPGGAEETEPDAAHHADRRPYQRGFLGAPEVTNRAQTRRRPGIGTAIRAQPSEL